MERGRDERTHPDPSSDDGSEPSAGEGRPESGEARTDGDFDELTGTIIGCTVQIHRDFGPGPFESTYEVLLAHLLSQHGLVVHCQALVALEYHGLILHDAFRADMIVQDQVVVEIKSVEKIAPVHRKQLFSYLRLLNRRVGLLLNFGCETLKEGIHRVVNELPPSASPRLRVNQLLSLTRSAE